MFRTVAHVPTDMHSERGCGAELVEAGSVHICNIDYTWMRFSLCRI